MARWRRRPHLRKAIFERDAFTCQMCGWKPDVIPNPYDGRSPLSQPDGQRWQRSPYFHAGGYWVPVIRELHVDHIFPVIHGGAEFDPANLQVLCNKCNSAKGARIDVPA